MAAFDFPTSPTVGQVSNGYTWDGEKWTLANVGGLSAMSAWTFKGNATAGNAVPTDVDIGALTLKSSPLPTDEVMLRDNAAAGAWKRAPLSGIVPSSGIVPAPQGRLTLQSGVPVMVTTQAAKTRIYYSPYQGNQVPIYNGSIMVPTAFAEISVLTTDTIKNPSAIGASKVNDWFVWNDSNVITLSHGPDWNTDFARVAGGALQMVNGILVNAVAITNGPGAQRGTWIGTTRSNASAQLDWIYGGTAAGGIAGWFGLWNAYNRRLVNSQTLDSTSFKVTINGAVDNLLGGANNRTSYVCGAQEDAFTGRVFATCNTVTTAIGSVFIGYDSGAVQFGLTAPASNTANVTGSSGEFSTISAPGFHFMQALQFATNGGNVTFYGSTQSIGAQTGMTWQGMM